MSNTVSLDTIRAAAAAKYGSYDVQVDEATTIRLLNPLRLTKEKRAELLNLQNELAGDDDAEGAAADVDQVAVFEKMILLTAAAKGELLVEAIGGDLAILAEIVSGYSEGTQLGEASASAA